jgi:hypothetical protein
MFSGLILNSHKLNQPFSRLLNVRNDRDSQKEMSYNIMNFPLRV